MLCCDCKSLLKTKVDGKDVLVDVNVLLKSCIYYIVVNTLLLQFNYCVKWRGIAMLEGKRVLADFNSLAFVAEGKGIWAQLKPKSWQK